MGDSSPNSRTKSSAARSVSPAAVARKPSRCGWMTRSERRALPTNSIPSTPSASRLGAAIVSRMQADVDEQRRRVESEQDYR